MSIIDKAAFIGMNGAKESMRQMQIITNNLANLNTPAFKSDDILVMPYEQKSDGVQTRIYSSFNKTYTNFKHGLIYNTGRDLDVALSKNGFFAVQNKKGEIGYTRAGNFELNADGMLVTESGNLVMGNNGPIKIPTAEKLHIGDDGTISALILGSPEMVPVDRIKIVNPSLASLNKGEDGLFYTSDGKVELADPSAKLISGSLEGSNVNMIETLTELIDQSRDYQIHTNLIKTLSEDASIANQILQI
jgi:flagellar basal-body rod protein FlgF